MGRCHLKLIHQVAGVTSHGQTLVFLFRPRINRHHAPCLIVAVIDRLNLGNCTLGEPEAVAGLWDNDGRYCDGFVAFEDAFARGKHVVTQVKCGLSLPNGWRSQYGIKCLLSY